MRSRTRNVLLAASALSGALHSGCSGDDPTRYQVPYRVGSPRPRSSGGATGTGGSAGAGGVANPCGCPDIAPLVPCCTSVGTCGFVVGAACCALNSEAGACVLPGAGGSGAGGSSTGGRAGAGGFGTGGTRDAQAEPDGSDAATDGASEAEAASDGGDGSGSTGGSPGEAGPGDSSPSG